MLCEKCWSDAYLRSLGTGKSQYTVYLEILEERKDNPCALEEAQLTKRALDAAHAEGCGCFECVYGKREPLVIVITPRQ